MVSVRISSLLARRCTCTAIGRANLLGCPKSFGGSLNPCCRSIRDARRLGDPARICVASPAAYFISCSPVASGRHSPHNLAALSTVHRYFQEWTRLGIWQRFWKRALRQWSGGWLPPTGTIRSTPINRCGYRHISWLGDDGKAHTRRIAVLVADAFKRPAGAANRSST